MPASRRRTRRFDEPSRVARGLVMTLSFEMRTTDGTPVDSSANSGLQVHFFRGVGHSLKVAIEAAMDGAALGETRSFVVKSKDAFGERDPALVRLIPRGILDPRIRVGATIQAPLEGGGVIQGVVTRMLYAAVEVDYNHPHVGKDIHCTMTVLHIREPYPGEIFTGGVMSGSTVSA